MDYLDLASGRNIAPGVYRYAGRRSTSDLLRQVAQQGWRGWRLPGQDIADKRSFLDVGARVMGFPAYFGRNWDAWEECMTDLAWAPAPGYLIVHDRPRSFARLAPADWQTALSIWFEVVEEWRRRDKPFYVLLSHTQGAAPEVPLLR